MVSDEHAERSVLEVTVPAALILLAGFVVALLFVGGGLSYAIQTGCREGNRTRAAALGYINDVTANSVNANRALLKNPAAPPQQKAVARANLDRITDATNKAQTRFAPRACSYWPPWG